MKICGVIAEYNPFHDGHAFQLAETRRILGADTAIVCVMSGNFVQRGDFAVLDKYRRAQAAAQCGADLVLELSLGAALSSAEGFARGAVRSLDALGGVGYLSFGSECGSANALIRAANLLDSPRAAQAFQAALSEGLSYAAARQKSLASLDDSAAELVSSPNNTLGLEYCRAIREVGSLLSPLSIRRRGAAHDSVCVAGSSVSASLLRTYLMKNALADCRPHMPSASFAVLADAVSDGAAPVFAERIDNVILSHLRRMRAEQLALYENPDEGFPNRLQQAAWDASSYAEACDCAQTRRYPLSRVRRAYLRAYLDLPLDACAEPPAYLRVLAIGQQGRALLRQFSKTCSLPLITKPLHEKNLPAHLQPALWRDAMVDELYALAQPGERFRRGGAHFRSTPFCMPKDD